MLLLEDQGDRGTITMEDAPEREKLLQLPLPRGPEHAGFVFFRIDRPRQVYETIVRESRDRRAALNRDPLPEALFG